MTERIDPPPDKFTSDFPHLLTTGLYLPTDNLHHLTRGEEKAIFSEYNFEVTGWSPNLTMEYGERVNFHLQQRLEAEGWTIID